MPVPAQAPDQPVKVEAPSGVAVRVSTVVATKSAEHVLPQSIPAGEEVIVPPPAPVLLTDKVYWTVLKFAVTDLVWFMVTVHVPVPLHAPDQPVKVDVPSVLAVRVTTVPVV